MKDGPRAVLVSFFERIVAGAEGLYRLDGPISPSEFAALKLLLEAAGTDDGQSELPSEIISTPPSFVPNLALLSHVPDTDGLLCVDFGTAASKVGYDAGNDLFEPLAVGSRAGEGNPFWVTSAVAIDANGRMVFGERALAAADVSGQPAITSFKSRLWADPGLLDAVALTDAGVEFSYRDCIQGYLAFLTQLAVEELSAKNLSRFTPRRYAMPFAYDEERRHVRDALGDMLGRAAILADSLGSNLHVGVEAATMRSALDSVSTISAPSWLVRECGCVGEPVAAGNLAMDEEIGKLTVYMIVDVGAGTTDFCILCLKKRADGECEPFQIKNGSLSIEIAGNAVDRALVDFLVRQEAGEENRSVIAAQATSIKERLFALTAADDEHFDLELPGSYLINVDRRDFLASKEWAAFKKRLRAAQAKCFDNADRVFLQQFGNGGAIRVVVTGGGSALPLRHALSEDRSPGEIKVLRVPADDFPLVVRQRFANNLADLPRLAVALGGSRPVLPGDFDRSQAKTAPGITAPYTAAPFDKTEAGLDVEEANPPAID
jgi:hypothetical protein